MSDQPTGEDLLGFDRYVAALRTFLLHQNTEPPLTVSIEGGWGSGKSSFMLQLRRGLEYPGVASSSLFAPVVRWIRRRVTDDGHLTAWFNPWRHENEDVLWAA